MQSYKFEHEKEIAKEIVRNKLVEFEYTITSEKSINNDFRSVFMFSKFCVYREKRLLTFSQKSTE